ncbi:MAG: class I SAM-dependent methyltransferase [Spirochaetes bacterium]|nr:class I SAM-dependent methyltransferase [Spirochaetota bacterium]
MKNKRKESSFEKYLRTEKGRVFKDKFLQFEADEEVNCILCGSDEKKTWYTYDSFKAVTCKRCGLSYMSPRLSNKRLQKVYEETYKPATDFEGRMHDMSTSDERARKRNDMKIEINNTLNYPSKGGRVLDVGCGAGIYLEAVPETWEKHGIDRAPWAAQYTEKILKIPVVYGEIENVNYEKHFFDVINMTYVIEHLRDPLSILKRLNKWMKPKGRLIISVPNFGSICSKIFREFYRLADPCQHIYLFNPRSIKRMLKEAGFKVKKVYYPYFNTPYFNFRDFFRFFINSFNRILLPLYLKFNIVLKVDKLIAPPFYGNIFVVIAEKSDDQ